MPEETDSRLLMLELEGLLRVTDSDFAALALRDSINRYMKWSFIAGSRNGRILQMKITPGIGPAGMALRLGIEYRSESAGKCQDGAAAIPQQQGGLYRYGSPSADGIQRDCPVMLAERLVSAAAYPLLGRAAPIGGMLLLGRRSERAYSDSESAAVKDRMAALGAALSVMSADNTNGR